MSSGRNTIEVTANGLTISGIVAPVPDARALIVALHGGGFTSQYFDVPGSEEGSLIDLANRAGYTVVCFDRPGHGASTQIPAAENSYELQAEVLGASAAAAADRLGRGSVFLIGHSIGGMIAAREHSVPLVGISVTGMGAVIPPGGASEGLRSIATGGAFELPADQTDSMMFGPPGTFRAAAVEGAHAAYAPALAHRRSWVGRPAPTVARARGHGSRSERARRVRLPLGLRA
jgi:pimeloyl-ACP methyl ester carboxylesterase